MLAISLSKRGQESKPRKKGWEPECKIREAEDWDPPVLLLPLNYISCTLSDNSVRNKTGYAMLIDAIHLRAWLIHDLDLIFKANESLSSGDLSTWNCLPQVIYNYSVKGLVSSASRITQLVSYLEKGLELKLRKLVLAKESIYCCLLKWVASGRGGGGYLRNFWVGTCRWGPGTLKLYQS